MTDELVTKLQKLWKRIDEEPKWYDQRDGYTKANKEWVAKLLKDSGYDLALIGKDHCFQESDKKLFSKYIFH